MKTIIFFIGIILLSGCISEQPYDPKAKFCESLGATKAPWGDCIFEENGDKKFCETIGYIEDGKQKYKLGE